jgi:hypothetical protein
VHRDVRTSMYLLSASLALLLLHLGIRGVRRDAVYLRLTRDGFELRYGYGPVFVSWSQVECFFVIATHWGQQRVLVHYRPPLASCPPRPWALLYPVTVPRAALLSNFGRKAEDLGLLLNARLAQSRTAAQKVEQTNGEECAGPANPA